MSWSNTRDTTLFVYDHFARQLFCLEDTILNLKGLRTNRIKSTARTTLTILCLMVLAAPSLMLETPPAAETRTVTADQSLKASPALKWLIGNDYRELWQTPIEVEVLDLQREAGGLRPLFRVGGLQTFGLAIAGADGKSYTFRSMVKDQGQSLPEDFREYLVDDVVQDQLSSAHPGGPLMEPVLAKAAGVIHNERRLVILPDDPALGEFRELYAGRLGTFEQFPTPASDQYAGFNGATEILSSKDMWQRMMDDPSQRIDVQAFLRARLFDFFIGDWDRHAKQWRWAKLPGKPSWQPIPEDRDMAFVNYDGLLLTLFRPFRPTLVPFRDKYPTSAGLTTQGWHIHRWLLPEVDKATWLAIAADMKQRLTDEVIDEAMRQMPQSYYELSAEEVSHKLKQRRDGLVDIAERIYRYLAAETDINGTDQSDQFELRGLGQGRVEVIVTPIGGGAPYFQREFHPDETRSLRLYLREGADTLTCSGDPGGKIKIEVIGQQGTDVLSGCETAKYRFTETEEMIRRAEPIRVRPDPFSHLPSANLEPEVWTKPRDWRYRIVPIYRVGFGSDPGFVLGGGLTIDRFEFGKTPFGQRHSAQAAYSFGLQTFEITYRGDFQHWNPRLLTTVEAGISGFEQSRFFGFGNETSDDGDDDFFETEQLQYTIAPTVSYALSPQLEIFAGGRIKYSSTDDDENTLLNQLRPYGVGDFGQLSFRIGAEIDTRDRTKLYGPGMYIRLEGSVTPEVWDVDSTFGAIEGEVAGYFSLTQRLLLALRVGGQNVFGTFPFQEAAYIGGVDTVRGLDTDRFAGDASVFANAELRFTLGRASVLLFRGEYGLFIFGDVGRVFVDDDDSDKWHPSGGGGISVSTLERSLLWSLSVARSEEQTSFFFNANFSF